MMIQSYNRPLHNKISEYSPLTSPGPDGSDGSDPGPWSRMLCWSQVSVKMWETKVFRFSAARSACVPSCSIYFSATLTRRERREGGEKDTLVRIEMFTYYEGLLNMAKLSFLEVISSFNLGTSRSVWLALFCAFARACFVSALDVKFRRHVPPSAFVFYSSAASAQNYSGHLARLLIGV